jgi:polar amino acid transport system substrate-binding protein
MKKVLPLVLILVLFLCGCGKEKLHPDLEAAQTAGVFKIGLLTNKPYAYEEDGAFLGFDCALAQAVARELGLQAEFVPLTWEQRWLALNEGSVDCVWGGITATDELGETLGLSQSYLTGKPVLVVPVSSQKQTDFTGARIAAEEGSACALAAEVCLGQITVVPAPGQEDALGKVIAGEADGAVVDLAAALAAGAGELVIREDIALGTLEFKAVFRQNSDLIPAVDKALTDLQNRGELEKLAEEFALNGQLVVG